MHFKGISTAIVMALLVAACGQDGPVQTTGTGPSAIMPLGMDSAGRFTKRDVNSCPHDIPTGVFVNTHQGVATVFWNSTGAQDYSLEIERRDADTDEWTNARGPYIVDGSYVDVVGLDDGLYRVHVRSHGCDEYGPWSEWAGFSFNSHPGPGDPIIEDDPPYDGGDDGEDEGGHGHGHQCHNGSNGDHNNDGHHDCGHGNGGHGHGGPS